MSPAPWSNLKQCACSRYFSADDAHRDCQRCREKRYGAQFRRRCRKRLARFAQAHNLPYKRIYLAK